MQILDAERSILVIIDLQGKLMGMVHRPEMVLETTRRLLALAELFRVPVLLSEQYPKGLGSSEISVREAFDALTVPKAFLEKTAFGCCGDKCWQKKLAALRPGLEAGQRQLVIAGIEAHICVMQTVLESLGAGESIHLVWDAISCRGEEYRHWALERMQAAGAVVSNHESVGYEWARDKDHEQFKAMSRIYKQGQPV